MADLKPGQCGWCGQIFPGLKGRFCPGDCTRQASTDVDDRIRKTKEEINKNRRKTQGTKVATVLASGSLEVSLHRKHFNKNELLPNTQPLIINYVNSDSYRQFMKTVRQAFFTRFKWLEEIWFDKRLDKSLANKKGTLFEVETAGEILKYLNVGSNTMKIRDLWIVFYPLNLEDDPLIQFIENPSLTASKKPKTSSEDFFEEERRQMDYCSSVYSPSASSVSSPSGSSPSASVSSSPFSVVGHLSETSGKRKSPDSPFSVLPKDVIKKMKEAGSGESVGTASSFAVPEGIELRDCMLTRLQLETGLAGGDQSLFLNYRPPTTVRAWIDPELLVSNEKGNRLVYNSYIHGLGRCVVKRIKSQEEMDDEQAYRRYVMLQHICSYMCEKLRDHVRKIKSIRLETLRHVMWFNFIELSLLKIDGLCYLVEPYLTGNFQKWSNTIDHGGARNNTLFAQCCQAFSHFTYSKSGKSWVLVDVQGTEESFTDPEAHCVDGRYGLCNFKAEGLANFQLTHRCNKVCTELQLPEL
eukprot:Lithocolla_globosa_v1_NODE_1039_length_2923_cov_6.165969.p1 type:complete len:525 gc:universal NODE_1039_length_2923_cov_6.165969:1086-2660(+)